MVEQSVTSVEARDMRLIAKGEVVLTLELVVTTMSRQWPISPRDGDWGVREVLGTFWKLPPWFQIGTQLSVVLE
ncbi:hypothetical protein V6N13_090944 [Hibiscus sabdariffa]|uniref:Uncharacterized protein n=1 Tax=Hibiscus sabdariffa TaxID=183260 RepID=A0ABR2ALP1_9ROSI